MAKNTSNAKVKLLEAVRERKKVLSIYEELSAQLGIAKLVEISNKLGDKFSPVLLGRLPLKLYFTLNPRSQNDQSLIEVFKFCGLNPEEWSHWRLLLDAFADVTFRNAGAKQKWTPSRNLQLLRDIEAIQESQPALSNLEIARRLKKKFGAKYSIPKKAETLSKLVGRTLNPHLNPLAAMNDQDRLRKGVIAIFSSGTPPEILEMVADITIRQETGRLEAALRAADASKHGDISEPEESGARPPRRRK